MNRHLNFLQACKSAYKGKFLLNEIPQGYAPLKITQNITGYSASSFISANTKQVIICNAGVNLGNFSDGWRDIKNFLWIKEGVLPEIGNQYESALQFTEEIASIYKNHTFHFLGHSMGAVFAELQGIKFIGQSLLKGDIVSFDSIGSKTLAYKLFNLQDIEKTPIYLYNLASNTFNRMNEQIVPPIIITKFSNDEDHILSNFELRLREYVTKSNEILSVEDDTCNNSAIRSLKDFQAATSFVPIDLSEYKKMIGDCRYYKWLSKEFLNNCDQVIKFSWMEDIFYGHGMRLFQDLGKNLKQASEDGEKYYGTKNVPIFYEELQVALSLNHDNELTEILDIGAGMGMTVWKELLSGAKVTALDLVYKNPEAKKTFEDFVLARVSDNIFNEKLTILNTDIFHALIEGANDHKEKYDLINIQNVIHFYCPKEIEIIINGIYDALKPRGMAVVTTNSLYLRKMYLTQECLKIYEDAINEKSSFPGYVSIAMKQKIKSDGHIYFDSEKICEKIKLADYNDTCSFKQKKYVEDGYLYLNEVWNDFDAHSLQKLFNREKFNIISTSYYGLTLGPGKIDDPEKSFSVSILVEKKSIDDMSQCAGETEGIFAECNEF
jgi:hypothetical protein